MGFLQSFEEMFSTGDPTVRTWFLVKESYLPFLLCTLYVVFCTILGPAIMRDKKPFELRIPMVILNFGFVFVYVYQLCVVAIYLPKLPWNEFCYGVVLTTKETPAYRLASAAYVFYIIKYVEFLDTVFFVLRKKNSQITKLHVIHHTLVPIVGWIYMRVEKSGFQSIPVLINAVVHVIMYSYYGLSAMGPRVQKYLWWKKYVTQIQMIQFVAIILFVLFLAPFSGCSMMAYSYIADMIIAPLFLYLFYQYYTSSFKQKPSKQLAEENSNGKTPTTERCKSRVLDDEKYNCKASEKESYIDKYLMKHGFNGNGFKDSTYNVKALERESYYGKHLSKQGFNRSLLEEHSYIGKNSEEGSFNENNLSEQNSNRLVPEQTSL